MTKATKAALWSGLVFPGTGHLFLKYYLRGAVLIAVSLISVWLLIAQATRQVSATLDKIQLDGGALDLNSLSTIATQASAATDNSSANYAALVLLVCWIAGTVDAYRLGKKKDQ